MIFTKNLYLRNEIILLVITRCVLIVDYLFSSPFVTNVYGCFIMKKNLILMCFFLLTGSLFSCGFICAQTTSVSNQTEEAKHTQQFQTPPPLPEITPYPRSKLEIIQYILLPFAIGASIWLILRLDKEELEEKGGEEEN